MLSHLLLQPFVVLAVLQLDGRSIAYLRAQGLELRLLAQAGIQRVEVLGRPSHETHFVVLYAVLAAAAEGESDLMSRGQERRGGGGGGVAARALEVCGGIYAPACPGARG
jgi:hypothetical protein